MPTFILGNHQNTLDAIIMYKKHIPQKNCNLKNPPPKVKTTNQTILTYRTISQMSKTCATQKQKDGRLKKTKRQRT